MTKKKSAQFSKLGWLLDWLDVLVIAAWDILLLSYWLTEKLVLLIHPKYINPRIPTSIKKACPLGLGYSCN